MPTTVRSRRGARRRAAAGPLGPIPGRGLGSATFGLGSLRSLAISVLQGGLTVFIDFPSFGGPPRLPPGALSQAQPLPVPAPAPQPIPNVLEEIFRGAGKAANDPVFRRAAARGIGRLSGIGTVLIIGTDILIRELEKRQQEKIARDAEEALEEATEERARARRARELAGVAVSIPDRFPPVVGDPDLLPGPSPSVRPERVSIPPLTPAPSPDIEPRPAIVPVSPVVIPSPRQPRPVLTPPPPVASPLPTTLPRTSPVVLPSVIPFFEPFSPFVNQPAPSLRVGDPLTGFDTGSVASGQQLGFVELPSPQPAAQAQTDKCRPRKCDDDLDEPRDQCFKGLYREGLLDTDFTQWIEIDCETGRELGEDSGPRSPDFPELRGV